MVGLTTTLQANYSTTLATVTIAAILLIVSVHLGLSYWIRKVTSFPISLIWLAGLSIFTSILWIGMALTIFYNFVVDCCFNVAVKPFGVLLFERTLQLPISNGTALLLLPAILFVAGLLVGAIIKTNSDLTQ